MIVFLDFHPIAPAKTNLCLIKLSFLSSMKASISVSRFFRGSIVPRYNMYGVAIGFGRELFAGVMPRWVT